MSNLTQLSDFELVTQTQTLVRTERETTTQVLRNLCEIERRKLFSAHGCSSLFDFCLRVLRYSEGAAQRRIQAMRLIRDMPEVEAKISTGGLSLSVAAQAQSFFRNEAKAQAATLTREQKHEVLAALEGKSTREAEKVLLNESSQPELHIHEKVRALSDTHTELRVVVSAETVKQLERIKGLMAHSNPNLTLGELVTHLANEAMRKIDPAREPSRKPKTSPAAPAAATHSSKRVAPAALRRAVFQRDGSRCTICRSQHALELDHIIPWARGGTTTLENLRLLCKACNARHAIEAFGVWTPRPPLREAG